MAAGKWDFTIEQGATFNRKLTWTNKNKTPINLTGYTAKMQVRKNPSDSVVLIELSTSNGRIAITGLTGAIELTISATDTTAITWKGGVFSLELTSPGGVVTRLLEGTVTVSPEITR